MNFGVKRPGVAHLEAKAATVEAGFVHGHVLLHKPAAQLLVLQVVQLAILVVI